MSYTRKSIQQMINELHGVTTPTLASVSETLNSYMGKSPNELNMQRYFNRVLGKRDTEYSEQQALFEILKGPLSLTGTYTQYDLQDLVYRMVNANITLDMLPVLALDYDNLVGYWPLNETTGTTANDYSSGNHDGTITGSTLNQAGKVGKAIRFDGNDDKVTIANLSASINGSSTLTILGLVNRTANTTYDGYFGIRPLTGEGELNRDNFYILGLENSNAIEFRAKMSGGEQATITSLTLPTGVWALLTMTYDGQNIVAYKNNSVATESLTGSFSNNGDQDFGIGADGENVNYSPHAAQHVAIFNSTLTPHQVARLCSIYGVA